MEDCIVTYNSGLYNCLVKYKNGLEFNINLDYDFKSNLDRVEFIINNDLGLFKNLLLQNSTMGNKLIFNNDNIEIFINYVKVHNNSNFSIKIPRDDGIFIFKKIIEYVNTH